MSLISEQLNELSLIQAKFGNIFKPEFYRITNENEKQLLAYLIKANQQIQVCDFIHGQLQEYIKYLNPSIKFSKLDLENAVNVHLNGTSIQDYGLWVYYPWSNKLVHILDEHEFIEVRTSRNQYKITRQERDILATKKIGVIGLSVGQSVSVTLAQERICTELRLADFDSLELTNLNRIRTGIHNLGLPKVYSVAREISEIDPFIKVICYPEGLTESNMDDFFTAGGNLDLMIEESDGFDIKILSRYKARELKIPVLMEASDRCMVDVERFDLEPNRDILHGLVNHLDIETLKTLKTNEEKIPYMLDIVGADTISLRAKASMLEIGETISTWPQLASAVNLGGGITADVARRLLLNYFTESGRYYVDIDELICNKTVSKPKENVVFKSHLGHQKMNEIEKFIHADALKENSDSIFIDEETIVKIVGVACTAPSGGNSQPWLWLRKNKNLYLIQDVTRSSPLLDFNNIASNIALGAAIENVVLISQKFGYSIQVKLFPDANNKLIVAEFIFYKSSFNATFLQKNYAPELADFIGIRTTNRNIETRIEIEDNKLDYIKNVATQIDGCTLKIITNPKIINELGNIVAEVERMRIMHPEGHRNFLDEMRWTKEENELKRDGVDVATCDLTITELTGFKMAKDKDVIDLLENWKGGKAFEKLSQKSTSNASAMGLIMMPTCNDESYINGGRAVQKVWIAANKLGVAFQPQSPCTFLFSRLVQGKAEGLNQTMIERLPILHKKFKQILEIENDGVCEVFLFRLFVGKKSVVKSLRRNVEDMYKNLD